MDEKKIFRLIENITQYESFKFVLSEILLRDFCGTADELRDVNIREKLDYNELILLAGLWIKNVCVSKNFKMDEINDYMLRTYSLMENLHEAVLKNENYPEKEEMNYRELFAYSPTNAYDFQYINLVAKKYWNDRDYIYRHYDQKLEYYAEYFRRIKYLIIQRLNDEELLKQLNATNSRIKIFILNRKTDKILFDIDGFGNFIDFFAVDRNDTSFEQLNDMSDFNPLKEKPIIRLDKDNYFIVSSFHLAEATWEVFFYRMLKTDYKDTALKNRGDFAEDVVYHYLGNVFKNVCKNVRVKRNHSEELTDIDVCVIHRDTMLLFMVKTKKLTVLSRQGNINKIRDDYNKAILSSFEQGLSIKKIVELGKVDMWSSDDTFKTLLESVNQVYLFTVTQDDYPYQNLLNHFFLEKYNEIPISINIFDLEVILNYIEDPDLFIEYTKSRYKCLKKFYLHSEIAFLDFFLTTTEVDFPDYDSVVLDNDWGQAIDADFYMKLSRGQTKELI